MFKTDGPSYLTTLSSKCTTGVKARKLCQDTVMDLTRPRPPEDTVVTGDMWVPLTHISDWVMVNLNALLDGISFCFTCLMFVVV